MSKRGLGRGLGALLSPVMAEGERFLELPIDAILPNPNQPRKTFNSSHLEELAASMRQSGVLQPILVRPHGDAYQLVVGERRWRAAKLAGLRTVPAVIRDATDAECLELALIENLLREDLNPVEEAQAYQRLLADFKWTQEELASAWGRTEVRSPIVSGS